jgi:DNA-directed RNA polymerase subunit RPC12/RpoP
MKPTFHFEYSCSTCNQSLTSTEVYDKGGICVHCGTISPGAVTHHTKKVYRLEKAPWWKFWAKPKKVYINI